MQDKFATISSITSKYEAIFGCLSEKGRRLWAAAEALSYGHGGISMVCQATSLARSTIHRGIEEVQNEPTDSMRVRKPGAGRKKAVDRQHNFRPPDLDQEKFKNADLT